jgi:RimJ/RimL family protein N-acetyltransferase
MEFSLVLFEKKHLDQLKTWEFHKEFLFTHYDFKGFEENDYLRWFKRKQRLLTKRIFAVMLDEVLIGFITMKHINWFKKHAEMGIVFNPGTMNQGYGTKGIELFLKTFFEDLGFEYLTLHVADFNRRAMKCYHKCGFTIVKSQVEAFEDQSRNFELLLESEGLFHLENNQLMTLVHRMKIDRADYVNKTKN